MRYIGPIVRNDIFFFVTMLALAGLMVLLEYRRRAPAAAASRTQAPRMCVKPPGLPAAKRCG